MPSLFCSSHVLLAFWSLYLFCFVFNSLFHICSYFTPCLLFFACLWPLTVYARNPSSPALSCYSHSCTLALFFVLPRVPVFARIYGLAWLRSRKILMQSPIAICSVAGLSSHKDIYAIPSTHLQCDRAEQPWRYWCTPQFPFAVWQGWVAIKNIWCKPQYPFAVWQGWAAMKILMQSPVPICNVTGLSSHEDIDAIPSAHLQCYRAEQPCMKILMHSPVTICSVTGLSSHEDIYAIPSTHLLCDRAEYPWRHWCNRQYPFAVLQGWAAMKVLMHSPVPICSVTGLSSHKKKKKKKMMQTPVPICSVTGLSSHEDIDTIPSSHFQCDRAE